MRATPWVIVEPFRLFEVPGWPSRYGDDFGCFLIPHRPTGVELRVIASSGSDTGDLGAAWAWDHVSVSLPNRCPNWPEMAFVKELFWDDSETAMQLHVPKSEHRNLHPYCLHLWCPRLVSIPRPPSDAVARPGTLKDNLNYRRELLRARR